MAEQDQGKAVVLVAMDKSESASKAFEWYVSMLHKQGNFVILLSIGEIHHIYGAGISHKTSELMSENIRRAKEEMREYEKELVTLMQNHGIGGKVKVVLGGRPGEVIVDMATSEKATYVVMGTRGLGKLRRTIMGSVSDYVLHHVHCPAFVYRH